jgi:CRP/FNR family cyclic AMP-dependent transcriptional regulator
LGATRPSTGHLTPSSPNDKLAGIMAERPSPRPGKFAAERLRHVPLFSHLSDQELGRILAVARTRTHPRNSIILFENDPGDALFVVLAGEVKVVLAGEDGREVILSILKEGDFFGEMALIDDRPRSANVVATADSILLVLHRGDFQACLEENPRIAFGLLQELSRRLRLADDKIGALVLLDVNGRIAQLLLTLADEHDGLSVPRTVTHHTIAQMIGSTRESVTRTLRDLQERGLIRISKAHIAVIDRAGLERLASPR